MGLKVCDVMTVHPRAIEAHEDTFTAEGVMKEHGCRHLLVTRQGELIGILSERELRPCRMLLSNQPGEIGPSVESLCVGKPFVVEADTALDAVTHDMAARRIGSAIVVEKGQPVGILTTTDVCRTLSRVLRDNPTID